MTGVVMPRVGSKKHEGMATGRPTTAQKTRAAVALALAFVSALTLTSATIVLAQQQPIRKAREFVRVQGYRGEQPTKVPVLWTAEVTVLGQKHQFYTTEWRQFGLEEDSAKNAPSNEGTRRLTLEGDRTTLRRYCEARPEQLVTILAERRPGSGDLFVLALDLCPPN